MLAVFLILAVTIALFLWDRLAMELVGFLSLLSLVLLGAVNATEATEGFSNGIVITMGGLFVLGGALIKTGITQRAGDTLEGFSAGNPRKLLALVLLVSTAISTVLSSTGTVALLIPAVVGAAKTVRVHPAKYLLPLAYGALLGGMWTLTGGSPNLIINQALIDSGRPGFAFFSFAWLGAPITVITFLYLLIFGDKLIPVRDTESERVNLPSVQDLLEEYEVLQDLWQIELQEGWKAGSLGELKLRSQHHLDILALREAGTGLILVPDVSTRLTAGCIFYARAQEDALQRFAESHKVLFRAYDGQLQAPSLDGRGVAEAVLLPRSRLDGRSLAEARFSRHYGVRVVKVKRGGQTLSGDVADIRLRPGDTLLVEGPWENLAELQRERFDFVVVGLPAESSPTTPWTWRSWLVLAVTALMLAAIVGKILPPSIAALLAASLVLLFGCLSMEEAYSSVQWGSLFLVATMLPMGTALANSGGIEFLSRGLLQTVGQLGPYAMLAGIYLIATTLGQVMSNTATAVLLAPLAMGAAQQMQLAPEPFLFAIAFGGSAAFLTPIASPGNALVVVPGGYKFFDFLKIGLPIHIAASLICILGIPLVYPF